MPRIIPAPSDPIALTRAEYDLADILNGNHVDIGRPGSRLNIDMPEARHLAGLILDRYTVTEEVAPGGNLRRTVIKGIWTAR